MEDSQFRSDRPIASALELVGDKWTLLVLRDMLFGARRFSDFVNTAEGVKRNILTDRLKRMAEHGLIRRVPYQDNPPRCHYHPTPKGADLLPVIQAMAAWGATHLPHACDPPDGLLAARPEDYYATCNRT